MTWTLECEAPMSEHALVQRHRLHNGLCLLSLVDKSAPIIAYQTWFGVGSRHEQPGKTGMAHFFEHLMFNQTKNLPIGEFDRRIEQTGGDTNAATWADWTYYRDSLPASELALLVELEAERMVNLVLDPIAVEAEREVVINERLQCIDDDIDGFAGQELFRHAFTAHPYRWPTIGWMDDIKALSIPDMQAFYRRYYSPDNATLVVVGDFDKENLLALVESGYGHLCPSGSAPNAIAPEPPQEEERRHSYQRDLMSGRLLLGYKGPAQDHADWPAVYFACQLLAGSASSPLYRDLVVERELASSLTCDVMPFAAPSLIEVSLVATRGTSCTQLLEALDSQLDALIAAPVPQSEIDKVRNLVETEFWGGLTTVDGKAEALGHYQLVLGDFRKLFTMAERFARIGIEEVHQALLKYFKVTQRTIVRIEPVT